MYEVEFRFLGIERNSLWESSKKCRNVNIEVSWSSNKGKRLISLFFRGRFSYRLNLPSLFPRPTFSILEFE